MAQKFNGELISADSRQVYRGLDIVTGKDHGNFPIHLVDVVNPDEPFSVSQWHDLALQKIQEIHSRHKLPIVVGGTGLYFRSLAQNLSHISIPPNQELRDELQQLSALDLFNKLKNDFPAVAASLNASDSKNPRRLIRHYEINVYLKNHPGFSPPPALGFQLVALGLSAPLPELDARINARVEERMRQGAQQEAQQVLSRYPHTLPSLSACGYLAFLSPHPLESWQTAEHQYARRQLTWFKKQPGIVWQDVSQTGWRDSATSYLEGILL